jgi:hypothetical protein
MPSSSTAAVPRSSFGSTGFVESPTWMSFGAEKFHALKKFLS